MPPTRRHATPCPTGRSVVVRVVLPMAAVALAAGAVGCATDAAAPSTTRATAAGTPAPATAPPATRTATTAPDPSTPSTDPEEAAILAAYQGYWDTWLAANNPPNPQHPDLPRFATGGSYAHLVEVIAARKAGGIGVRAPDNSQRVHRTRVVSRGEAEATIEDCAIDDLITFEIPTGRTTDDSIVTTLAQAHLVLVDGGWKVEGVTQLRKWIGIRECVDS